MKRPGRPPKTLSSSEEGRVFGEPFAFTPNGRAKIRRAVKTGSAISSEQWADLESSCLHYLVHRQIRAHEARMADIIGHLRKLSTTLSWLVAADLDRMSTGDRHVAFAFDRALRSKTTRFQYRVDQIAAPESLGLPELSELIRLACGEVSALLTDAKEASADRDWPRANFLDGLAQWAKQFGIKHSAPHDAPADRFRDGPKLNPFCKLLSLVINELPAEARADFPDEAGLADIVDDAKQIRRAIIQR